MVETKAAKRKSATKVARRASHELHAEVKKIQTASAEKKAGAGARAERASVRGTKALPKKAEAEHTADEDKEMVGALAQGGDDGSDSEGGEGEDFDSQRLVVKLDPKQKQRLTKGLKDIAAKQVAEEPGQSSVIYIGRVPFGFFEDQMQAYFKQFGDVKRLRLSRNKKTGKSKHFAFVEFEHPEVAEIVASTHNNMLMCDRAIKCTVVPKNRQHDKMWRGADEKFVPHNFKFAAKEAANGKKTAGQEAARIKKLVKKEKAKRKKFDSLGIDLDFKGYEGLLTENKPKRMKFTE
jgi:nucleolar protein 15